MADQEVIVQYQLRKTDFSKGLRSVLLRLRPLWAFPALSVVLLLAGAISGSTLVLIWGIVWFAMGLVFIPVALVLAPYTQWRHNRAAQGEHIMTMTAKGVTFQFDGGELRGDWSYFHRVLDLPNLFVVLHGRRSCYTVPKRFMTPVIQEDFRNLVRRHTRLG